MPAKLNYALIAIPAQKSFELSKFMVIFPTHITKI